MTGDDESVDALTVVGGLRNRLLGRSTAQGSMTFPAVPAMLDSYVDVCLQTFRALGVDFTDQQVEALRAVLLDQVDQAFAASPRSQIVMTYTVPVGSRVDYHVHAQWSSVDGVYDTWVETREPPLFGVHPDAKVMALAASFAPAKDAPVLDLGAGTGRNALALARAGHPVDAIELSGGFADILERQATEDGVNVSVLRRDALASPADLRRDYALIVASEFTSDFRSEAQIRRLFHIAASCLRPGGLLVTNMFITRAGYVPDAAARQLGQQVYTSMFMPEQVREALAGLPLVQVSDESAVDFERSHLPDGSWPPTSWFDQWASGCDLFAVPTEESPIELRWLVFQKGA